MLRTYDTKRVKEEQPVHGCVNGIGLALVMVMVVEGYCACVEQEDARPEYRSSGPEPPQSCAPVPQE
jgi:hypothetical protein